MKVCVVGSGAREHAIAHVLSRTADVIVTPGNPGMRGRAASGHTIASVTAPPEEIAADLFVIGPEAPLVAGLADRLRARGDTVVGPGALGARLEGSKAYMKQLASRAGVPSARFGVFDDRELAVGYLSSLPGPYVVKTDGLAAGKGVLVTEDFETAVHDIGAKLDGSAFGPAGRRVVIEEAMVGPEVSLLVLCDGKSALPLPAAQDAKRVGDDDCGPNTGGMGAYSPVPVATDAIVGEIMERIVNPTLATLRHDGVDYRGILYAGCMLTEQGPKLVEFNVRLGDPEAEVVLLRLDGDVAELLMSSAVGHLRAVEVSNSSAVAVVVAAHGYPVSPRLGDRISGLDSASTVEGVTVFHGGTREQNGELEVAGGRIVTVSALGADLREARTRAYAAVSMVEIDGAHHRSDIAQSAAAIARKTDS